MMISSGTVDWSAVLLLTATGLECAVSRSCEGGRLPFGQVVGVFDHRNRGCPWAGWAEEVDLVKAVARLEPGQRVRASRPARVGTTIAAATVCSVIRVAAEPASKPNVRSGTKDSAVSATAVRTNVGRGRGTVRAMTAAMPTPTSEKTSVSCANPAIGMLAPVLSANETPAADATAARTVVATEATTAAATPCFQTGCRWAVGVVALGVLRA